MSRFRRSYERRRDDERGATLIIVGICATLFIWAGAFTVDLGIQTVGNRQLQATADAGALDAARYIDVSGTGLLQTAAQNAAKDNGSSATMTATLGYWTGTKFETQSGNCSILTPYVYPPCNAVSVTAAESVPELFHGGSAALSRSAIAAINVASACGVDACASSNTCGTTCNTAGGEAGISIGTYLTSYTVPQVAALNTVLSLLGTSGPSVNLTAVGYEGLAQTDVTVQQLISASAGLLTPANVLTATLNAKQWAAIFYAATGNTTLSTGASDLGSDFSTTSSASLCQMVSINGSTCSSTLSQPALSATINVLQTLTTEAEVANGTNAINLTSAFSLTGVSTADIYLNVGQVPATAYGPVGYTEANTSQVTADVKLTLSILGVAGETVDIPLSAAEGTAYLNTVSCQSMNNSYFSVKIAANTTAESGNVTLAGTTIATSSVGGASSTIPFGPSSIPPTTSTESSNQNPVSMGTTSPSIIFNGLSPASPVYSLLDNVVSDALGPVLTVLGVNVGGADVGAYRADCTDAELVP
jgi:uncharacterized membrane protein